MLELARTAYPKLCFRAGSLTCLDPADRSLAEVHRVLVPGGLVLLAFQVGDDVRHVTDPDGSEIALDFHRLNPDVVTGELVEAGFAPVSLTVRPPDPDRELVPQAALIARRLPV